MTTALLAAIFVGLGLLGSAAVAAHDALEGAAEREQAALENFEAVSRGGDWQEQTAALKTRGLLHRRNTR